MVLFKLIPLSPKCISATAQTFFDVWEGLPSEVNIRSSPLNTLMSCRDRLENMLSQPDLYEITVAIQAESEISAGTENKKPTQEMALGFLAINKKEKALDQLFVHPGAQSLGLGGVLLEIAKTKLPRENGGFWLRTAEGNLPARRFYERKGLRLTPTFQLFRTSAISFTAYGIDAPF
jgi:GNAT superfamily N-acetyltransferase